MPRKKRTLVTVAHENGTTLRKIAKKVGVHYSYLSHLAAGRRAPTLKRAFEISKALGVSLEEFRVLIRPPRAA